MFCERIQLFLCIDIRERLGDKVNFILFVWRDRNTLIPVHELIARLVHTVGRAPLKSIVYLILPLEQHLQGERCDQAKENVNIMFI